VIFHLRSSLPEPERGTTLRLVDDSQLEPGAVFRFPHDERPLRVLVRDADAVMYDCWWPHLDGWGLADLGATKRQRINYYVTTVPTVVDKGIYLRSDPLSDDTTDELLRKAHAVQAKHLSTVAAVDGVGIYRSGLQRGLPAFYVWGAESRLHQQHATRR
jgi:hypothetical protein